MKTKAQDKGQSIAEWAILIAAVSLVFITIQTYVTRGLQGRYRDASDGLISALREVKGDQGLPLQYEPERVSSEITTTSHTSGEERKGYDDGERSVGYQATAQREGWRDELSPMVPEE